MNAVWIRLLIAAVKALAGAVVWDSALKAVTDLMRADLSGDEKRAIVLSELKRAFRNVPTSMLNLAIEIAVTKATPK